MEEKLEELTLTVNKIKATDERRNSLTEYRDRQLAELREAGATWAKLQEITGLTPMGLKKALDRTKPKP